MSTPPPVSGCEVWDDGVTRVTILGAGDMGTALATPLAANGHDVRLWGTKRDAAVVAALSGGDPHPRLGTPAPAGVRVFAAGEAEPALAGAEIVVVAISSDAVRGVVGAIAPWLGKPRAIVTVAKGFDRGPAGDQILLLPDAIAEFSAAPIVAVGGPSKANEVARSLPTAVVFGGANTAALARCRGVFTTPTYRIATTDDVVGLEVAAAMKNAYAIALGMADGLERATGQPHHNLRAALFPRAVAEIGLLAETMGGRRTTVVGLAGSGDLQVTITAGRNRLLGERIGAGEPGPVAARALTAAGTTVEGFLAVGFGHRLAQSAVGRGQAGADDFALLGALHRILHEAAPAMETLWGVIEPVE